MISVRLDASHTRKLGNAEGSAKYHKAGRLMTSFEAYSGTTYKHPYPM